MGGNRRDGCGGGLEIMRIQRLLIQRGPPVIFLVRYLLF